MRTRNALILLAAAASASLLISVVEGSPPAAAGVCKPLSSEFDFPKNVPPHRASDLAFCKEFRQSTCCDKSTSLSVLRALSPYFDPDAEVAASFSERCRQVSSMVACSPCDPLIGTGKRVGICPALCENWFNACRDGLFTEVEGQLRPCSEGSLICAPLHAIVSSGAQFCERTGFGVGSVSRAPQPGVRVSDDVARLIRSDSGEAAEEEDIACFDGSVPRASAASSSSHATDADAAASASSGNGDTPRDSPKRYYKSAEELAAIEARRKARGEELRQAEIDKAWEHSGVVLAARSAAQLVRSVMTPLQRSWGRFVRGLPLPRSLTKHLDAPFVFSLVLLALNMLLWSVGRSWMARCCGGARRRGDTGTLSAAAAAAAALGQQQGWTAEAHPAASAFSALSASGLSADEVRQQRAEKLLQAQYAAANKKQSSGSADTAAGASESSAAGTYTAIIDGELLTIAK